MKTIEELEKKIEYMEKEKELNNKYISVLEKRLKSSKEHHDKMSEKYNGLYKYAEKLCSILENQDKQIDSLMEVNNQLKSVNEQLVKKLNDRIFLIL